MTPEQIHLAAGIVAVFSALVGTWQAIASRYVHWLWLLLLLLGLVAWAVTR